MRGIYHRSGALQPFSDSKPGMRGKPTAAGGRHGATVALSVSPLL
jgi:hypothetical protein